VTAPGWVWIPFVALCLVVMAAMVWRNVRRARRQRDALAAWSATHQLTAELDSGGLLKRYLGQFGDRWLALGGEGDAEVALSLHHPVSVAIVSVAIADNDRSIEAETDGGRHPLGPLSGAASWLGGVDPGVAGYASIAIPFAHRWRKTLGYLRLGGTYPFGDQAGRHPALEVRFIRPGPHLDEFIRVEQLDALLAELLAIAAAFEALPAAPPPAAAGNRLAFTPPAR